MRINLRFLFTFMLMAMPLFAMADGCKLEFKPNEDRLTEMDNVTRAFFTFGGDAWYQYTEEDR